MSYAVDLLAVLLRQRAKFDSWVGLQLHRLWRKALNELQIREAGSVTWMACFS